MLRATSRTVQTYLETREALICVSPSLPARTRARLVREFDAISGAPGFGENRRVLRALRGIQEEIVAGIAQA